MWPTWGGTLVAGGDTQRQASSCRWRLHGVTFGPRCMVLGWRQTLLGPNRQAGPIFSPLTWTFPIKSLNKSLIGGRCSVRQEGGDDTEVGIAKGLYQEGSQSTRNDPKHNPKTKPWSIEMNRKAPGVYPEGQERGQDVWKVCNQDERTSCRIWLL